MTNGETLTISDPKMATTKLVTKKRVLIIVTIILILFVTISLIRSTSKKPTQTNPQTTKQQTVDNRVAIQAAQASVPINRNFTFNVTANGQALGKINYSLNSAELRNEIVVKGETATAVKGRTFLIINLKLKNDLKTPLTLNTRNFIRLSVNNNTKEWLAPDIHNDPVEIQAISTKLSRVGFPISDSDKNLKLQLGEIDGEKTIIDLNFK